MPSHPDRVRRSYRPEWWLPWYRREREIQAAFTVIVLTILVIMWAFGA